MSLLTIQTDVTNGDGIFSDPYNAGTYSYIPFFYAGTTNFQLDWEAAPLLVAPAYAYRNGWLRYTLALDTIDTINSAYLKLKVRFGFTIPSSEQLNLTVRGHLTPNSAGPANLAAAVANSTTNATVATVSWPVTGSYSTGSYLISPDITDVIRELIDQGSWVTGNHITLYIRVEATTTSQRTPQFENAFSGGEVPLLIIDYTDGIPTGSGYDRAVESDVDFIQDYAYVNTGRRVYSDVDFQQDISYAHIHSRVVVSDVFFENDVVDYINEYERDVSQQLLLAQEISYTTSYSRSVEHELVFETEIIRNTPHNKQIVQGFFNEIDFQQTISYNGVYYRSVEHEVTFDQSIAVTPIFRTVEHTLLIEQSFSYADTLIDATGVVSDVTFDQDISYSLNSSRTVESVLDFEIFFSMYKGVPSGEEFDDVHTGSGPGIVSGDAGSSVPPSPPVIVPAATMTLQWPIVTPTQTVIIRSPLFGNQEILDIPRVQRNVRGGEIKTFVDEDWPVAHRTKYQFDGISDTLAQSIRDFFTLTLGLEIKMTDYEGTVWHGFVINPSGQFTDVDATTCDNTAEFEFDGVRQ